MVIDALMKNEEKQRGFHGFDFEASAIYICKILVQTDKMITSPRQHRCSKSILNNVKDKEYAIPTKIEIPIYLKHIYRHVKTS